jgi:hypothetical protein
MPYRLGHKEKYTSGDTYHKPQIGSNVCISCSSLLERIKAIRKTDASQSSSPRTLAAAGVQEVVCTYVDSDEGIVSLQQGERCQVLSEASAGPPRVACLARQLVHVASHCFLCLPAGGERMGAGQDQQGHPRLLSCQLPQHRRLWSVPACTRSSCLQF